MKPEHLTQPEAELVTGLVCRFPAERGGRKKSEKCAFVEISINFTEWIKKEKNKCEWEGEYRSDTSD